MMIMSIEYRKLKSDGHCSYCGKSVKKDSDKVRIVTFYYRSKNPMVNICQECAYKIFYAPTLVNDDGVMEEDE